MVRKHRYGLLDCSCIRFSTTLVEETI